MNFADKSIWIWQLNSIDGGDAAKITARLKAAGFEGAMLHHENLTNWRTPARVYLTKALQDAGIAVYGSAAVYGSDAVWEGRTAAALTQELDLAGFVFDAESTWDSRPDRIANTNAILYEYHQRTTKPSGWCWWARYKSPSGIAWHPVDVLKEAMKQATVGIPMAYWSGNTAAEATSLLQESFKQWREITNKPILPGGRAYNGDGGSATAPAIAAFASMATALGAKGITFWSMQHAITIPDAWQALAQIPPFHPPQPELEQRLAAAEAEIAKLKAWQQRIKEA